MNKVLIVDDESALRAILRIMVQKSGNCEIHEAGTLCEAYALCKSTRFDAIFMDHNLADGIGWKLAEDIRKDPEPYGNPKLIGMSGSVPYDTKLNLFDLYMQKPFSPENAIPAISSVLSSDEKASK